MRPPLDLPDDLLEQTKIAAVKRCASLKALVVEGPRTILDGKVTPARTGDALARLRAGYHLGRPAPEPRPSPCPSSGFWTPTSSSFGGKA